MEADIPMTLINQVNHTMQKPVLAYAKQISQLAGDNAVGLTLFGSIATGSFDPKRHTAQSVLVLDHIDLTMLRELSRNGAKLGKANIAAPLIMTPAYIRTSLDSFPLEFLEIAQCHMTISGEDCFAGLPFEERHIRLQCERELKGILVGMRQGLLAAAGREKLYDGLETESAERLIRTLRGILWLKGVHDGYPETEVITQIEKKTERSLAGVRNAINVATKNDWEGFKTLYADVEALGKIVDCW
jgi:hypothetical protein